MLRLDPRKIALLAWLATLPPLPPKVVRCQPTTDDQSLADGTGVCSVCGRRVRSDERLPECKGAEHARQ